MKYKGFELNINPKDFTICTKKKISESVVPYDNFASDEIGKFASRVTGSGVFYGNDAVQKAHELLRLFNKKGSDYLFLPSGDTLKCYFEKLEVKYSSSYDRVEYSFGFLEDIGNQKDSYSFGYTYANDRENLFDVANRTGVKIEKLVEANDFQSIYAVSKGDKIWLM